MNNKKIYIIIPLLGFTINATNHHTHDEAPLTWRDKKWWSNKWNAVKTHVTKNADTYSLLRGLTVIGH